MPEFLDPGMLWWLAAGVPAILILYFLRLRRERHDISSTLLWRRSVYDLRVNAPMQMIRRNLLLFLQLLALILLILALARPYTELSLGRGRHAALILDASASMGTRDAEDGQTRLAAAKAEALRLIDNLGVAEGASSRDRMCVILAADKPVALCPLTSDRARLRQAVESISLHETTTDMNAALRMAVSVTGVARNRAELVASKAIVEAERADDDSDHIGMSDDRPTQANVIVLSDGVFEAIPEALADQLAPPTRSEVVGSGSMFLRFGETESDNLAIVAADLQSDPAGIDDRQLFLRVENYGTEARRATLTLRQNDEFVDERMVEVSGRSEVNGREPSRPGRVGMFFSLPAQSEGMLEVELRPADGREDLMLVDNTVRAVMQPPEPIRCLLVGEDNFFLETALRQLQKTVRADHLAPAAYESLLEAGKVAQTRDGRSYEVVIFDRYAPKRVPLGASFYIDAVPDLPGIREEGTLYAPWVVDWNRVHPLMRNLSLLDRLVILRCKQLALSQGWASILDGQGVVLESEEQLRDENALASAPVEDVSLLACLLTQDRRVAVLGFDIFDTQRWVMRVSFPLFIRNVVHWLARPEGLQRAEIYKTGETLRARFEAPVVSPRMQTPGGAEVPATPSGTHQAYFSETQTPGVYRMRGGEGQERLFAVSLLSAEESDNPARERVQMGETEMAAGAEDTSGNADLWPYVVMVVLGLFVLEWYVYNRRILG